MLKKYSNYLKHLMIHLMSFIINYVIFIVIMLFIDVNNIIGIQVSNLIAWIISMLFIFFIDKKFVPDLVDEHNSSELFKFILIRLLSLMIEILIIYIFVTILRANYYSIKLISLVMLFFFNSFYVRRVKFN